jgi:hypothetical protein
MKLGQQSLPTKMPRSTSCKVRRLFSGPVRLHPLLVAVAVSGCLLSDDFEKVPAATGGAAPVPDCPSLFSGNAPADCDQDLLFDNDNCCVTGRSCLSGDCVNGQCRAITLGTSPENQEAPGVVPVGDWVVWTTGNGATVLAVPKAGGDPVTLATVTPPEGVSTTHIATDGTYVYWVDFSGASIRRVAVDPPGTMETIATVPDGLGGMGRIVVRDGLVFFAMSDSEGIWLANADGSSSFPTMIAEAPTPYGLAVDDTHVYWAEQGFDNEPTGKIRRLARAGINAGGEPEDLETEEAEPGGLAIDDTHVYWVTRDGAVSRMPKDGSSAMENLSIEEHEPNGLRVDDVFVYWTDPEGEAVRQVRKNGEGLRSIVSLDNGVFPQGLAQDCDTLYFTADDRSVRMVPK